MKLKFKKTIVFKRTESLVWNSRSWSRKYKSWRNFVLPIFMHI